MTDDLAPLIERIREEAVAEAERRSEEMLASARAKAAAMVEEARAEAEAVRSKARSESENFAEQGKKTLEQAARDLLITVTHGIENILSDLVAESVHKAMDLETLKAMLASMAGRCAAMAGESRMDILVSEKDRDELTAFFADLYKQRMVKGLELHVDNEVLRGFKVSFKDDYVYLDFTSQTVADALARLLRPHLAEIVRRSGDPGKSVREICACLGKEKRS